MFLMILGRFRSCRACPLYQRLPAAFNYSSNNIKAASDTERLTLWNLGFKSDDDLEANEHLFRKKPYIPPNKDTTIKRSPRPQTLKPAVVIPPDPPSPEEMKQAALDARNILAEAAGIKLPDSGVELLQTKSQHVVSSSGIECRMRQAQVLIGEEDEDNDDDINAEEKYEDIDDEEEERHDSDDQITGVLEPAESAEKLDCNHPWSEWVKFLQKLYAKGCFEGADQWIDEGKPLFESYSAVRHAICAFGRERGDIFRSLKRKDLRVLANYGCPDLERKSSNASKRLRLHFEIPEGDVCQKCRLKMSCPRAFLAPPTKLAVTTLDVVRIIAEYATNALPGSESFTAYPNELQTSACNLLEEMIDLYELPIDPSFNTDTQNRIPTSELGQFTKRKNKISCSVPEKPGDWVCPNCEFMNFNRNKRCKECKLFRPPQEQEMLLGDWQCPKCRYLNFSRNNTCRECKTERPTKTKWHGGERLPVEEVSKKNECKTSDTEDDMSEGQSIFDRVKSSAASNSSPVTRKTWMEKSSEKDYEASDEEGSAKEIFYKSSRVQRDQLDIHLSDEENEAVTDGTTSAVKGKVPKPLFNWSEDEEGDRGAGKTKKVIKKKSNVASRKSKRKH